MVSEDTLFDALSRYFHRQDLTSEEKLSFLIEVQKLFLEASREWRCPKKGLM